MKPIKNIKDIAGYEDWSHCGQDNYSGFRPTYINGDQVHEAQVMNSVGYEKKGLLSVDVESGEYWIKLDWEDKLVPLYMANLEHEVVWDCFIRDDAVPQITQVPRKVRSAGGGSFVKMVDKEIKGKGYYYGRMSVAEMSDSDDGSVLFCIKEVDDDKKAKNETLI